MVDLRTTIDATAMWTFRVHAVSRSGEFHKCRRKPVKTYDPSRTRLWTFLVQIVDLPRTTTGPSAYFHRTFRVHLNRKQEKQVYSRGHVNTGGYPGGKVDINRFEKTQTFLMKDKRKNKTQRPDL
jgi:hypothetical protein